MALHITWDKHIDDLLALCYSCLYYTFARIGLKDITKYRIR